MAKKGTLTVKVLGDSSDFKRKMGEIESSAAGMGSKVVGVGKKVAAGVGIATVGAVALGTEVLNTGAKLEGWRKKTDTVFEGSADSIREWADKNNETFGITDDELAGLAASFGDLLKPMGFTSEEAAGMSKDVIGLSGALSEWTGGQKSAADVSAILSKAMLGEREGLKELGISISEADVQQRLLEKGQEDLTGAALQQAKAMATQELIFEKSADAQKAYADGGNKALRSSNRIKAGLAELREQMADKLLPIALKVADWLGEQLPKAVNAVRPTLDAVGVAFVAVGRFVNDNVLPPLRSLGSWLMDNKEVLVGVGVAIGVGLVAAFTAWAISAGAAAIATAAAIAPVVAIGAAIAALVAGVIYAYENVDWFREAVDKARELLVAGFKAAIDGAKVAIDVLWAAVETASGWLQTAWEKTEALRSLMAAGFKAAVDVVKTTIDVYWSAIETLAGWIQTAWDKSEALRSLMAVGFKAAIDAVKVSVDNAWAVVETLAGWLQTAWDKSDALRSLMSVGFKLAVDGIKKSFDNMWGSVETLAGWLQTGWDKSEALRALMVGGFKVAIDAIRITFDTLKGVVGGTASAIQNVINKANSAKRAVSNIPGAGIVGGALGAIPGFHSGGTFSAPRPGGEGLALLRDGERITAPEGKSGGPSIVTLDQQSVRDIARALKQMGRAS